MATIAVLLGGMSSCMSSVDIVCGCREKDDAARKPLWRLRCAGMVDLNAGTLRIYLCRLLFAALFRRAVQRGSATVVLKLDMVEQTRTDS